MKYRALPPENLYDPRTIQNKHVNDDSNANLQIISTRNCQDITGELQQTPIPHYVI